MDEKTKTIIDRARALDDNTAQGPWRVGTITEDGNPEPVQIFVVDAERDQVASVEVYADAELIAFAVNSLGTLCDAVVAAEHRAEEAEAQCEASRAEFAALGDHFNRNVLLLNDIAMQVCCTHFERLPDTVRELVAGLHAAEAKAARMFASVCPACHGRGFAQFDGGLPSCAECESLGAVIAEMAT